MPISAKQISPRAGWRELGSARTIDTEDTAVSACLHSLRVRLVRRTLPHREKPTEIVQREKTRFQPSVQQYKYNLRIPSAETRASKATIRYQRRRRAFSRHLCCCKSSPNSLVNTVVGVAILIVAKHQLELVFGAPTRAKVMYGRGSSR